jgi:hypothetical protein
MPDRSRLVRLSNALYWTALSLSVVLPLIALLFAGLGVADPASLRSAHPAIAPETPVSRVQAGLVAAVALVAVLPLVAALRAMAQLFDSYRSGIVLSAANADTILRIGRALILVALFTVLAPTLQLLILSWSGPSRMLALGLDGGTLGFLMAAGLLTVIGWAMREAALVKAENEEFV